MTRGLLASLVAAAVWLPAHANSPPPIPADPVTIKAAREIIAEANLDKQGGSYEWLWEARDRIADRLRAQAGPVGDSDFEDILAHTFRRQAEQQLALERTGTLDRMAERLGRSMSLSDLKYTASFFGSPAGKRFADVVAPQMLIDPIAESQAYIHLVNSVPATVDAVRQSVLAMRKANQQGGKRK